MGRVEIVTLTVGVRAKKEEGGRRLLPPPLDSPHFCSLRKFQHGAFAIKTIRARPMKTPALQAKTDNVYFEKVFIFKFPSDLIVKLD